MKKTILLRFFLFVGLISLINSCSKQDTDSFAPEKSSPPEVILEKAKDWYSAKTNVSKLSIYTPKSKGLLTPNWKEMSMCATHKDSVLIISAPAGQLGAGSELSAVRKFVFNYANGRILNGRIIEFYGALDTFTDNTDSLLNKYYRGESLPGLKSVIEYELNYKFLQGKTFNNGNQRGTAKVLAKPTRQVLNLSTITSGERKTSNNENRQGDGKVMSMHMQQAPVSTSNTLMSASSSCTDWYLVTDYGDGTGEYWDYLFTDCGDDGDMGGGENFGGVGLVNPGTGPSETTIPEGHRPLCKSSFVFTPVSGNSRQVNLVDVKFGITDMPSTPWGTPKSNVIGFNLQITIPNVIGSGSNQIIITDAMAKQYSYLAYHYASQMTNLGHGDDFFSAGAQPIYSQKFVEFMQFYLNNIALEEAFGNDPNRPTLGARVTTMINPSLATPAKYTNGVDGSGC